MRTIKFRIWSEKFKRYFYTVDEFRELYQSIDEDESCKPYNNWWLEDRSNVELSIVSTGKTAVWVVSVDYEMVGIK